MDSQRESFLAEIRRNPHDELVRSVYADWLDEHDEPEEADFFRSWTLESHLKAEEWLDGYAADVEMTRQELLGAAAGHLSRGEYHTLPFDTPDRVYLDAKEFWEHFSVVTGTRLPHEGYEDTFISCAC